MTERYLIRMLRHLYSRIRVQLAAVFLIACTTLSIHTLHGQTTAELRVKIDAGERMPVNGALVALIDESGKTITEVLSPESGRTILRAPAGKYRIRVRRIGFRPFFSQPLAIPRLDELLLNIETPRVVLDAIVVSASAQCGGINHDAQALGAVWDEIEKALRSSEMSVSDLADLRQSSKYTREVSSRGGLITNDTSVVRDIKGRPFGARNAAALTAYGYILGDESKGWEYFAPDETVLLSDEFTATHCFRLVRDKKRKGAIGVSFSPIPKRRLPDIDGVLWVDEKTSELREVRFHYVNAGILTAFEPSGFTSFYRLPSGAWIVKEWQLRLPKLERGKDGLVASAYLEFGGRVVTIAEESANTQRKKE